MLAEADGNYVEAATGYAEAKVSWERYGHLPETGLAALAEARVLAQLGKAEEAQIPLRQAREIIAHLGASVLEMKTSTLLNDATPVILRTHRR
jgi:hypothetical protein